MEELENDISYVYSGFAPISVRLVQCVAQKGGVLSNPAAEKEKKGGAGVDAAADGNTPHQGGSVLVQAHPIVGWKGFEDVIASLPGETVDVVQKLPGGPDTDGQGALPPAGASLRTLLVSSLRGFRADVLTAPTLTQCFRESGRRRRSCFSSGGARTRRSLRSGGWGGRTKVGLYMNLLLLSTRALLTGGRWGSTPLGRKFLIATTGIINGNSMIDSIAGTAGATSKEVGL